jgi:CheY-like chemotaxis protein
MARATPPYRIWMVDDDREDCSLVQEALREIGLEHSLQCVRDGEELFDRLLRQVECSPSQSLMPHLVLLDLNMPRMDGRETMRAIRCHPLFRRIPVVMLTTSAAEDDVAAAYALGANSYLKKPATFQKLVDLLRHVTTYWFELVELPAPQDL